MRSFSGRPGVRHARCARYARSARPFRTVVAFEAVLAHRTVGLARWLARAPCSCPATKAHCHVPSSPGRRRFRWQEYLFAFEVFDQQLECSSSPKARVSLICSLNLAIRTSLTAWIVGRFQHADRLAGRAFDGFEQALFTRGDEQDRFAAAAGTARAADAVGIAFRIVAARRS